MIAKPTRVCRKKKIYRRDIQKSIQRFSSKDLLMPTWLPLSSDQQPNLSRKMVFFPAKTESNVLCDPGTAKSNTGRTRYTVSNIDLSVS